MCASSRPEWKHFRERRGSAGVVLWHVITPTHSLPHLAHRMDLSSRCHRRPHIPAMPMLWLSGPAAEKPLPRGQAQPPTSWYIRRADPVQGRHAHRAGALKGSWGMGG